jgi:hypothetical protein
MSTSGSANYVLLTSLPDSARRSETLTFPAVSSQFHLRHLG